MNPDQTGDLLELLAAANVLNRLDDRTPDVWHAALGDLDYADCMRIAAHLIRTQQWVKIADIRNGVRDLRNTRAADIVGPGLPAAIPDADPDDVHGYLAAIKQQRTRAGDGELKPRPVAELLAKVGRDVPDTDGPGDREPPMRGPTSVECGYCGSEPMRACRRGDGTRLVGYHPTRIEDARRSAAGQQPIDHEQQRQAIQELRDAAARALAELPPDTVIEPQDGFTEGTAS